MFRVAVIGTGKVGSAVALLLNKKGHNITAVCSKNGVSSAALAKIIKCAAVTKPESVLKDAEIILLATPDRELSRMVNSLTASGNVREQHVFLHMSGALPAEVLRPLTQYGAKAGSLHPLQACATVETALSNLPGSFYAVQGDERAVEIAFCLVEDLEGFPFKIHGSDKPLYHLGACVASNYLVALVHYAVNIYKNIGLSSEQAVQALMPLIKGTLNNIETMGPAKALTGPVARGDIITVEQHLDALSNLKNQSLTGVYKKLGHYTMGVAAENGSLEKGSMEKLIKLFREEDINDV